MTGIYNRIKDESEIKDAARQTWGMYDLWKKVRETLGRQSNKDIYNEIHDLETELERAKGNADLDPTEDRKNEVKRLDKQLQQLRFPKLDLSEDAIKNFENQHGVTVEEMQKFERFVFEMNVNDSDPKQGSFTDRINSMTSEITTKGTTINIPYDDFQIVDVVSDSETQISKNDYKKNLVTDFVNSPYTLEEIKQADYFNNAYKQYITAILRIAFQQNLPLYLLLKIDFDIDNINQLNIDKLDNETLKKIEEFADNLTQEQKDKLDMDFQEIAKEREISNVETVDSLKNAHSIFTTNIQKYSKFLQHSLNLSKFVEELNTNYFNFSHIFDDNLMSSIDYVKTLDNAKLIKDRAIFLLKQKKGSKKNIRAINRAFSNLNENSSFQQNMINFDNTIKGVFGQQNTPKTVASVLRDEQLKRNLNNARSVKNRALYKEYLKIYNNAFEKPPTEYRIFELMAKPEQKAKAIARGKYFQWLLLEEEDRIRMIQNEFTTNNIELKVNGKPYTFENYQYIKPRNQNFIKFRQSENYKRRTDSSKAENKYIEQIEQNTNQEFDVKNMLKAQIDYEFSEKEDTLGQLNQTLSDELDDSNVKNIAQNHTINTVTTLEYNNDFFRRQPDVNNDLTSKSFKINGQGDVLLPVIKGGILQEAGSYTYGDWLSDETTQTFITNNNGFIDPPIVKTGTWKQYTEKLNDPNWNKVVSTEYISLTEFNWTKDENGKITAIYDPQAKAAKLQLQKAKQNNRLGSIFRNKKNRKYLDDVDVGADLPLGQPIEIKGLYFMKVLSNGRSIDSTQYSDAPKAEKFHLAKITEQQLRDANKQGINLVKTGLKMKRDMTREKKIQLQKTLEAKFNVNIPITVIDVMIKRNEFQNLTTFNYFNLFQIQSLINEIKAEIERQGNSMKKIDNEFETIAVNKGSYLKNKNYEIKNGIKEAIEKRNAGTRIDLKSELIRNGVPQGLVTIAEDIINEHPKAFDEKFLKRQLRKVQKSINFNLSSELQLVNERKISELDEINLKTANPVPVLQNFDKTQATRNAERMAVLKRSNINESMKTLLDQYAENGEFTTEEKAKLKPFLNKSMFYHPELWKREEINKIFLDWAKKELPEKAEYFADKDNLPPSPHDIFIDKKYITNNVTNYGNRVMFKSANFLTRNTWRQSTIDNSNRLFTGIMTGATIFGLVSSLTGIDCEVNNFDPDTGAVIRHEKCENLNIRKMIDYCEYMSINTEGIKYVYDINIGAEYQRRHTPEDDFLAQDPEKKCTKNEANDKLLKETNVCDDLQKCSVYNEEEESSDDDNEDEQIYVGEERLNLTVGEYSIREITNYTQLSLDALAEEFGLQNVLTKFVLGLSVEEFEKLNMRAQKLDTILTEYESI